MPINLLCTASKHNPCRESFQKEALCNCTGRWCLNVPRSPIERRCLKTNCTFYDPRYFQAHCVDHWSSGPSRQPPPGTRLALGISPPSTSQLWCAIPFLGNRLCKCTVSSSLCGSSTSEAPCCPWRRVCASDVAGGCKIKCARLRGEAWVV